MSLEMITTVDAVFRRDREVSDTTLLDPTESTALVQGEWLRKDTSTGKMVRATAATTRDPEQVFSQKGDFAVQALGKITVLELHEYEAETDMFDGGGTYAYGTELTVKTVTIDTIARSALAVAVSTDFVHAICEKPPQLNGGKLRFKKRAPFIKP